MNKNCDQYSPSPKLVVAPDPKIMKAVEQLGYRVTLGDVAAFAGLNINLAQQGLLALASDAGGHLQVAESGEIAYLFPKNFRSILRNKFLRLQLQEWWEKVWRILFYLIRISFGILLLLSIVLIFVAIILISLSASGNDSSENRGSENSSGGGGIFFFPSFWIGDIFWLFNPSYERRYQREQVASHSSQSSHMNFLEAVFSFLFGNGNPNHNLEECRWRAIGIVIRNSGGAVVAEQIAPYLDDIGEGDKRESEDYILPVLTRFDGRPEVSPEGEIIYHFPQLQTTALLWESQLVRPYLRERFWRFSRATSGQIMLSIGLGAINLIGALVLGSLLKGAIAAQLGGFVAFVQSIYWVLLGYGIAFLAVPLIRYFWIQLTNSRIARRNQQRQERTFVPDPADTTLQKKIAYAQQFAVQNVITQENLVYTSETDLLDQEIERSDKIDDEWQRRLESNKE